MGKSVPVMGRLKERIPKLIYSVELLAENNKLKLPNSLRGISKYYNCEQRQGPNEFGLLLKFRKFRCRNGQNQVTLNHLSFKL
jgi:hypothetical protein